MASPPKKFLFHRADLARKLIDAVSGEFPFDQSSGLFLAAPRRTGKSTFLRFDLVPELEKRGVIPILVDLWADPSADPAALVIDGIKQAIRDSESGAIKVLREIGLSKFGAAGMTFDIDKVGVVGGITIVAALEYLFERTGRSIALIVDEAQHALNIEAGTNMMFALKAARDAMNQNLAGEIRLMLICTGSNRDKLSRLVLTRDQPFFGARVTNFPLLDRDYSDVFTDWINARLAESVRFDADEVFTVFETVRRRPEELRKVMETVIFSGAETSLSALLADEARALRNEHDERYEAVWSDLDPLQRAVLAKLVRDGQRFAPFSQESLSEYTCLTETETTASMAQKALAALRDRNIVWQPAKGSYSLEDTEMADWLTKRGDGPLALPPPDADDD